MRQAATHKDLAEKHARLVLEDDERGDELAEQTPEDFARSRHKEIVPNPRRKNMRTNARKSGNGNGIGSNRSNPSRINQAAGASDPRLVADLLDDIGELKAQNKKLQSQLDDAEDRLDQIDDVVSCNDTGCNAEDHLSDVRDILDGNGGGNGDGGDDD